jgi:hypothetical protein
MENGTNGILIRFRRTSSRLQNTRAVAPGATASDTLEALQGWISEALASAPMTLEPCGGQPIEIEIDEEPAQSRLEVRAALQFARRAS